MQSRTSLLLTCSVDVFSHTVSFLEPLHIWRLRACGDRKLIRRFQIEPIITELRVTQTRHKPIHLSLLLVDFGSRLRVLKLDKDGSITRPWARPDWIEMLPKTLVELDFDFPGSLLGWLRPTLPNERINWRLTAPQHAYTTIDMGSMLPNLETLRLIDNSRSTDADDLKLPYVPSSSISPGNLSDLYSHNNLSGSGYMKYDPLVSLRVHWTDLMMIDFVRRLPPSLHSLHLSASFDTSVYSPYLPPSLSKLHLVNTGSMISDQPIIYMAPSLFHSLIDFQFGGVRPEPLAMIFPSFEQLQTLDLADVVLSGSHIALLPRTLSDLKLNCYARGNAQAPRVGVEDLAKLPRGLFKLRLLNLYPLPEQFDFDIGSTLPPHITNLILVSDNGYNRQERLTKSHLASLAALRELRHLEVLDYSSALLSLDWVPKEPLRVLVVQSKQPTKLSEILSSLYPSPTLTSLTLMSAVSENIEIEILASSLPPNLTKLALTTLPWKDCDCRSFRTKCPASLTRLSIYESLPELRTSTLPIKVYNMTLELPSSMETLSYQEVSYHSTTGVNWHQHCINGSLIHAYALPLSITRVDLPDTDVDYQSPIFNLPSLENLSIHNLLHPPPPASANPQREPMKQMAKGFSNLTRLSSLRLNAVNIRSLHWLKFSSLQQGIVKLKFTLPSSLENIDLLKSFKSLADLELNDTTFIYKMGSSRHAAVFHAVPNSVTRLSMTHPPVGVKMHLSHLSYFECSQYAPNCFLMALPASTTALKLGGVLMTADDVDIYKRLDRNAKEFSESDLILAMCPSVKHLQLWTPRTIDHFHGGAENIKESDITWHVNKETSIGMVQALPRKLTKLRWAHAIHSGLIQHLPKTLTQLDIVHPVMPGLNYENECPLPKTLKTLAWTFSIKSIQSLSGRPPKRFLSWLPRGLETLITNLFTFSNSQIKELPKGIKRLFLPRLVLDEVLAPFIFSMPLTTLVVARINSPEALKGFPKSLTELRTIKGMSNETFMKLSDLDPPLIYLPHVGHPDEFYKLV